MAHSLVHNHTPRDVIETLEQLISGAKDGHVVGLAFAAMLKRRRYFTAVSGECHRDPTYARGIVAALDDELAALVHARADESTR